MYGKKVTASFETDFMDSKELRCILDYLYYQEILE